MHSHQDNGNEVLFVFNFIRKIISKESKSLDVYSSRKCPEKLSDTRNILMDVQRTK